MPRSSVWVLLMGVLWSGGCASDGAPRNKDVVREEEFAALSARIRSWRAERMPAEKSSPGGCYFERAPASSLLEAELACRHNCTSAARHFLASSCLLPMSVTLPHDVWHRRHGDEDEPQRHDECDGVGDVDRLRRRLFASFAALSSGADGAAKRQPAPEGGRGGGDAGRREAEGGGAAGGRDGFDGHWPQDFPSASASSTCLLIMGDSMMRQVFNSLVHVMRGADHVVDFNHHTHARYSVCDNEDALSFPAFDLSWDYQGLVDVARQKAFWAQNPFSPRSPGNRDASGGEGGEGTEEGEGPRGAAGGGGGGRGAAGGGGGWRGKCSRSLDVWYLWLPSFATQEPVLEYLVRVRRRATIRARQHAVTHGLDCAARHLEDAAAAAAEEDEEETRDEDEREEESEIERDLREEFALEDEDEEEEEAAARTEAREAALSQCLIVTSVGRRP